MDAEIFFESENGRALVRLLQPVGFRRSLDCFVDIISQQKKICVISSALELVCMFDESKYSWSCWAPKPSVICDIDPSSLPNRFRAATNNSRPVKSTKRVTSYDAVSPMFQAVDGDMMDTDADLMDELVRDAASIHDGGLTIAHQTEDDETKLITGEEADIVKDDKGCTSDIASARAKGLLPATVEVPIFGGNSCYMKEELEANAVQSVLMRCHGVTGWL